MRREQAFVAEMTYRARGILLLILLPLLLASVPAHASDPADRTFTPLGGGSVGESASVGASGNLAITLPLDLPLPRGDVPLPLSVSYDGSNVVGAAGLGWDIHLAGVTWQHNLSRRKPIHRFQGEPDPAPADRVMLDTGSGPTLMARTETPGVYQPFGSGYFELRFDGTAFTGRDSSGRRWIFQHIPALFDDDFYALTSVVDVTSKNRVDLAYDVFDRFSPNPIRPPFVPGDFSMRELVLHEITHSPDVTGRCPKYRIQLEYTTWSGLGWPVSYPNLLGVDFQAGRPRAHARLLDRIKVRSNINTSCQSLILPTDRTYVIQYASDELTGQPRLAKVDMFGRNDPGTNPATALPVVAYRYASPLASGALQYAAAERLSMPAGPPGALGGISTSLGTGAGSLYGLVRDFQDFDGDGRADFVTLDSTGQKPKLSINRPSSLGNDFSTFDAPVDLPNDPAAPYTIGAPDLAFGLPVLEAIDNTYQQVIDFNGDGRPDIVIATEGRNPAGDRDPNYWEVLINTPGPSGEPSDIVWVARMIDVSAVRAAIQSHHVLSLTASSDQDSKPLPLARTIQVGAFANNVTVEAGLLTQWKLIDVNGDGFPDMVFDTLDVTAFDDTSCDATGNCVPVLRQDHPPTTRLMVIYHTGPMMAGSGADTQNVWRGPPVLLRSDGACGVERLTIMAAGKRQLACGFMEVNGDGIPDYVTGSGGIIRAIRSTGIAEVHDVQMPENQGVPYPQQEQKRSITLPGPVGVITDGRTSVCGSNTASQTPYTIEQQTSLRDITGDGIADYIWFGTPDALADGTPIAHPPVAQQYARGSTGWWFMAGTGVGFGAPLPVRAPADLPFALHVSRERCDGQVSSVIATLKDIDGDGRPELVRVAGPSVRIAKLLNGAGELGAHSASQLVAIDNRYGSVTRITWGSAKSNWLTRGNRAAPEIVVTQMERTADRGLGNGMAPVRYAYGAPEVIYHPLLGRWIFTGYRRRVTLVGEPTSTFGVVKGRALVGSSLPAAAASGDLDRLMLAGGPADAMVVAGDLPDDPRRLLVDDPAFPPFMASHTAWQVKTLPGAVPILVPLDEECYATPPVQSPGQFGDLVLCRRVATAYVSDESAWQGTHPFPASDAITTHMQVTAVDDYGRPTRMRDDGDRNRPEDDVCAQIDYASPVAGAALVLAVPHTVRTVDCANSSRILAGVRFRYDGVPEGQVSLGFPSSRVIERHDVSTAALLDQIEVGTLTRDLFGNVAGISRSRPDGASATTTLTYDPFGLRAVRIETTATGLANPLVTQIEIEGDTLLPLTVTTANGAKTYATYDAFNRRARLSVSLPGDATHYVLVDNAYLGFNGGSTGRSVQTKTYHRWTPEAQVATADPATVTTSTTQLDELGRRMYSILDLGGDYAGKSLIVNSVVYDGIGRPRFAANPFLADIFGPKYGVTFTYRADGRSECAIAGTGPQTLATTDATVDRYPRCLSYLYANGALLVRVQGPNEIASSTPQSGAYDERALSATGQILSRSRKQGAVELERTEYAYDRLGGLSRLTRFADAQARTGNTIWTWTNDSLGNVLGTTEPAGVARTYTRDAWDNITAVAWRDSTGIVAVDRGLRFTHDGLSRLLRLDETVNGHVVPDAASIFMYDVAANNPAQLDTAFLLGQLSFARTGGRAAYFGYDALGRRTASSRSDDGDPGFYGERSTLGPAGETEELDLLLPDQAGSPERILYDYDSARRLRVVRYQDGTDTLEAWRAMSIDPFGHITEARFGNGVTRLDTYRDGGRRERLSRRTQANGESRLALYDGYDGGLRLRGTSEITASPGSSSTLTTTYTYDARNALARVIAQNANGVVSDVSYTYDGLGNIATIATAGAGTVEFRPFKFDPDRLCAAVAPNAPDEVPCTYGYDALGSVRFNRATGDLFTYDGQGRLSEAERGGRRASFDYGPLGEPTVLRIIGTDGQRRERLYGAGTRVDFLDATGAPVRAGAGGFQHYIERQIVSPAGTVAVARRADDGTRALLYPIGDFQATRMVLGASGEVLQDLAYAPFGEVADLGDPTSLSWWPYQWNGGRVLEGLGLVAMGKRVLDPRVGRFLQRDPVINRRTAVSAHPYAFAMNDPVNNADPSGLDCNGNFGQECQGPAGDGFLGGGPSGSNPPGLYLPSSPTASGANPQAASRPPTPTGPQTSAGRALKAAAEEESGIEFVDTFNFDALAGMGVSVDGVLDRYAETPEAHAAIDLYNAKIDSFSSFWAGLGDAAWFWCPGCAANARRSLGITSGDADRWAYAWGSITGIIGSLVAPPPTTVIAPSKPELTVLDTEASIQHVNFTGGRTNCANCALATDATLAGNPASALPGLGTPATQLAPAVSWGQPLTETGIVMTLQGWGPGSRGIIFGTRASGINHFFNVANRNGVIVFVDGQNATASSTMFVGGYTSFFLFRTN
jgi:RHS repeat-associated protein